MRIRKLFVRSLLLGGVLFSTTGCKSLALPTSLPWSKSKLVESKHAAPTRMVAIWSDDVITQPGKPTVRGFGGRLYFYNEVNSAIEVEGQLVVYAYDDAKKRSQPQGSSQVPDRKFVFTVEQFKGHHSETDLGHSYSVWIPWDDAFGESKEISLLPVFTSSVGQVVMGQQSANLLPGRNRDGSVSANRVRIDKKNESAREVRPVAHETQATAEPAPTKTPTAPRTTTIHVPESLTKKMAANSLNIAPEIPATAAQTVIQGAAVPTAVNPAFTNPTFASPPAPGALPPAEFGGANPNQPLTVTEQFQKLRTGRLPMETTGLPSPGLATLRRPAAPTSNLPAIRSALGSPPAQSAPTVPPAPSRPTN